MPRNIVYTIEQAHNRFWVCQRGVYEESSVLAGQEFRQLVKPYDSVEKAKADYPEAVVELDGVQPEVYIPVNPPTWFHPEDAGESWAEDY